MFRLRQIRLLQAFAAMAFSSCTPTGTPDGTAIVDDCGECLEPNDSNFNQSCNDENQVYIPNAFSPNDDGLNDRFQVFKKQATDAKVNRYLIFNRWGELIFESKRFEFNSNINWWNREYKGQRVPTGVYVIEQPLPNGCQFLD